MKNGKLKNLRPTEMDVVSKKSNPFTEWIEQDDDTPSQTFYLPDEGYLSKVWKHLGVSRAQFEEAQNAGRLDDIRETFRGLWRKHDLESENISLKGVKLGRKIKLATNNQSIQFANTWISLPHLDIRLRRAILGVDGNANNPFARFTREQSTAFLPDVNYLPELYERLGVASFEALGFSAADYSTAWEGVHIALLTLHRCELFGETIGITQEEIRSFETPDLEVYYLERLPETVLQRLKLRLTNLQGAGGLEGLSRDVLQAISTPGLRGKDLVSLCRASKQIDHFCNQDGQRLFRARLEAEFGIDWRTDKRGFPTPRELYVQLYTKYYGVILDERYGHNDLLTLKKPHPDLIVRVVPGPHWREEDQHFLFFFPDMPDLTFLIHQDSETDNWELDGKHPSEDVVDSVEFSDFVFSILDTQELAFDDYGIFGDVPELDWLMENLELSDARRDQADFLYVWRLM